MPRLMAYNIEWFTRLFHDDNSLRTDAKARQRLDAIAAVLAEADPDLVGITEAPNTTTATGQRNTVIALETFATAYGLRQRKAVTGYISAGEQEIALLLDPDVLTATHDPGGRRGVASNAPFDEEFRVDSDGDDIDEVYRHYRPPLEARIDRADGGAPFWLMVVHAKSKGIFDAMDKVHFDRTSERNRRKLFAECTSIRRRVDEWQKAGRDIVVMGDINDGPGFDYYEGRFGRSAVELIMGDLFQPEAILANRVGAPRWGKSGWEPSTARFRDQFTGNLVNALIDHIMLTPRLAPADRPRARIWNPWQDTAMAALPEPERDRLKAIFDMASDHMPVTIDID